MNDYYPCSISSAFVCDGVHCIAADGELIGKIRVPETVANLAFGDPKRNRLFITAGGTLYGLFTGTRGVLRP